MKRAFKMVRISRVAYDRLTVDENDRDAPVIEAFNAILAKHGRCGFWKFHRSFVLMAGLGITKNLAGVLRDEIELTVADQEAAGHVAPENPVFQSLDQVCEITHDWLTT